MSASALVNNRFLARAQPEGLGSTLWTRVGNDVSLVDSANNVIIGAGTVVGAERFRVVGDVRIEGKLTVTGSIDPTDVQLSGGTELFFGSADGSTAPVAPAGEGRLRYNNGSTQWEASVNGGAYAGFGVGGTGVVGRLTRWSSASAVNASLVTDDGAGNLGAVASLATGIAPATAGVFRLTQLGTLATLNGANNVAMMHVSGATLLVGGQGGGGGFSRPAIDIDGATVVSIRVNGGAVQMQFAANLNRSSAFWQWRLANMFNEQTLGANRALATTGEAHWQRLDPGGADRTVQAPLADATNLGDWWYVANTADADELLSCLGNAGAPVVGAEVRAGGNVLIGNNGTLWRALGGRGVAAFGGMWIISPQVLAVPDGGSFAPISWEGSSPSCNMLIAFPTQLRATISALYEVSFTASIEALGATDFRFVVFAGGVQTDIVAEETIATGLTRTVSGGGIILVGASDFVDVQVTATAANNLVIHAGHMRMVKAT